MEGWNTGRRVEATPYFGDPASHSNARRAALWLYRETLRNHTGEIPFKLGEPANSDFCRIDDRNLNEFNENTRRKIAAPRCCDATMTGLLWRMREQPLIYQLIPLRSVFG